MKIKHQLRLFLFGIIAVPILCVAFIPIYNYLTRPEKILMTGSDMIKKMCDLPMSKRDIHVLRELMKTMPPKIEFIILENYTNILMTNFPDFEGKDSIEDNFIFQYMNDTGRDYFYQLVSPPLENKGSNILLISRVNRNEKDTLKHNKKWDKMLNMLILFILIFESFSIFITIYISNTITKSITILEKNTEQIASGELDVEFEKKDPKHDNEITRLTENLDKMRLILKDNAERRSKFIMGISHDLRTPVAVIKGYTEAMSDGVFDNPKAMEKSLEIISSKTEQLETMIDTLISCMKLNQTDWQQTLKKQNIVSVINEFAKSSVTTGEIFKRNVKANTQLPEMIEVPFDKLLFQRALENIFTNAVRYTREEDNIYIESYYTGKKIILKIQDSGIGIEEKDINKIFDMFYRGTNSRRESGMGIGLSVVKTIIKTHGWSIDVKSKKGEGTEFVIEIPIEKS